jgi:integrase
MALTDIYLKRLTPDNPQRKHADSDGLFVVIDRERGTFGWRFKYRIAGREKLISFGRYPEVSLKRAREKRDEARALMADGKDPSEARQQAKRATGNTLQIIADEFVKNRMERATPPLSPRTIQKAKGQLREFIYPRLGQKPIQEITVKDIREALQAITVEGKRIETAYKTKELLGRVFKYAINQHEHLEVRNIPADLETKEILGKRPDDHLAAILERPKVGELLRAIDGYDGQPATVAALRLLPHVFLRSTELRGARWPEVNFKTAQWTVPKSRMKPGKSRDEHFVPLSQQSLAILKDLHKITGRGEYLFPAIGPKRRPISENTLGAALAALGYDSETQTPHGFRAIFRTIAAEDLEIRIDWLELQLAHEVKDSNGRAYNRASFLPQRAKVMQQWSDYLDTLCAAKPGPHK